MKEKLFKNVNGNLKKAACILAIGGLALVSILGLLAVYTTWQYTRGMGGNRIIYILTTIMTYVAMGFAVLISGWALYSFAELAEDTKTIKDSFFDDGEDYEWADEEDEETCSCGCDYEKADKSSPEAEEDK